MAAEKRKATNDFSQDVSSKKAKWTTPKRDDRDSGKKLVYSRDIEAGDIGIWASCNKGKEGKCVAELKDLFQEYADRLYVSETDRSDAVVTNAATSDEDVDAEMQKELEGLRNPQTEPLFTSIKLDTPCLVFFKVRPPIEPVTFVHIICKDAAASAHRKQSRSVKRLTPITLVAKATESGLEEVAQKVLAPHFHQEGVVGKKFAIRPNIRNHSILSRDVVIKQVANIVGPGHKVDLKAYDLLILVEIYKNICGVSVVGSDFDQLKRYNLSEIFEPTPAPKPAV